ncbi:conserved hypothetical protein [Brucella abortus NCTC 8038]|uniref:Uncharacterized protein n=5 Tax=Brucella TaxID=234 RepID=Q579T0_BRUAB|nr:hypothetical protein BRA0164 [Brucella suis 1330]AAX75604.1 hypothetical protein BruAb2_0160 [Brucella abortus bv. 1 str. 9-941]ABX63361.1 Hypothetical protein, conserved [Brucella canis ATCC 23365]ABY39188.1 Hypothetical protein, conserved [Brucella suis ATCC 23445]ACO02040.1 Hypothetical protein, conserved [Brucella melitensis ATCC 23457]AEK55619.1 hypothetical protein BPI_II162 [Brucella pinnipedialis B2/94]EEW81496.1 conserved hypothetical protein [Brucella abortus NCTC 8038]EEW87049.
MRMVIRTRSRFNSSNGSRTPLRAFAENILDFHHSNFQAGAYTP